MNIALLALPFILIGPLLHLASWRPRAIMGDDRAPLPIEDVASALQYGPDGTLVVAAPEFTHPNTRGTLRIYLPHEKRWGHFENGLSVFRNDGVVTMARLRLVFSADGKTVFAPAKLITKNIYEEAPKTIQAYDVGSRKALYTFGNPINGIFDISPDGKWAAYARNKSLVILDLSAAPLPNTRVAKGLGTIVKRSKTFRNYPSKQYPIKGIVGALHFSPDSKTLAAGFNEQIALFDMEHNSKAAPLQVPINQPHEQYRPPSPLWLQWSPDGKKLASYASDEIAIFDANLHKLAATPYNLDFLQYESDTENVATNILWLDDETLVTGGEKVQRWWLRDLKKFNASFNGYPQTLELQDTYNGFGAIALSPDGSHLTASRKYIEDNFSLWQWRLK